MLLNTWLSAAKRHLFSAPGNRALAGRRLVRTRRPTQATELLEDRALLTALVINSSNVGAFINASGTVVVNNTRLGAHDSVVIEDAVLNSAAKGLTINLSNVNLESIAIESTDVTAFVGTAIEVNLTNVTGLNTIAIEDVAVNGVVEGGNGLGISISLSGTDVGAITIDDSEFPGVRISAANNSDILNGLVTQNTIVAPAGFEGVSVTALTGSTANNFRVMDNLQIDALDRDAVKVKLTDSPLDGLVIANNVVGTDRGADVLFRAEGDTFLQPFRLQNNAIDGERITEFVFDLSPLGLVFDIDPVSGKPFTVTNDPGNTNPTGIASAVLDSTNQILTVTFDPTAFGPGEVLEFVIDVDIAPADPTDPPVATSIFGNDLVGAQIDVSFTAGQSPGSVPKSVSGLMIADPDEFNASQFAVGAGAVGNTHGINLDLTNSPVTNATISGNSVTGVSGHGILLDAKTHSDVTGVIRGNTVVASGQDGLHFALSDSDFAGAVIDNVVGNNSGHGINFQPNVSRRGLVEDAFDQSPVVITSTNHGLVTGDEIIVQGMVNDIDGVNHPGNGRHTVTRIDNNRFSLQGVSGLATNVSYSGGGAWYVPDFQGGVARNLVTIDLQAGVPEGSISAIAVGSPVTTTSVSHGLSTGDWVRVRGAAGVLGVNGVFQVTVTSDDTFTLNGSTGSGSYDTSEGLATWEANVVTGATNSSGIVITAPGHGLESGEEVRIVGVEGNTAANGTFEIVRIDNDTFRLKDSTGNGVYTGQGTFVRLNDLTSTGDRLPQRLSGNSITGNRLAGIYVDLTTGTVFNGDIVGNDVSTNGAKGIHVESHSFGLGSDLPLDPTDPEALPSLQDISFNVNIGSAANGDGNTLDRNVEAGILIEALDFATGSFEIRRNRITSSQDDTDPANGLEGDGIVIRMQGDQLPSQAVAILAESVIDNNVIGVDNQGNEGHGLSFILRERSRIQDLRVTDNNFLNNALDGFHFVRSEDGDLNSVVFERNNATNNGGDGFDLFAINTVRDRLDFRINENNIDDNGEYGVRIDVQADARIEVDFNNNSVRRNGAAANGSGYHPNDGVPGSAGAAGGVGIHAFQQVEVLFNATQSHFDENFGDGFSVDAFNFFDTLTLQSSFTDSTFNSNSLTGFRNHGASFGTIEWTRNQFSLNGEDGARSVSIEDKTDFFERRVGGSDIDVTGLANQFTQNGQSGLQLGQGVSAVLGDGTIPNANIFDNNGEDGLKITQDVGSYLAELERTRHIQADLNFYRNNQGDGVDIGHFAVYFDRRAGGPPQVITIEGGNVEHGDEVTSDVNVVINNSTISGNDGDGIEYLGDSWLRLSPIFGGGQDVDTINVSSLTVSNSRINNNEGRGIDILNRVGEDSRVNLINNQILSNGLSGVYVMNTASHLQLQNGPEDPLDIDQEELSIRFDDSTRLFRVDPDPTREIDFEISPNIELRVQDNRIESNGTETRNSVVPVNQSNIGADASGVQSPDWTHSYGTVTGTLGGLVVRVGTADSAGRLNEAETEFELGLSGIDAEVVNNTFDGNIGADFYIDSFVSQMPLQTLGWMDAGHDPMYAWGPPADAHAGYRDPLARIDLVFRGNVGNSLDVTNGFAFLDNVEDEFKSRNIGASTQPPNTHAHGDLNPNGNFADSGRKRNLTRTLGFFDSVGQVPGSRAMITDGDPGEFIIDWSYDGHGTPTMRVESDFVGQNTFPQTSGAGPSDFFDTIQMDLTNYVYQWDTGVNTSSFIGDTPFSLDRGDVFNVRAGEAPIEADSLEQNDSFAGAYDLGTIAGAGFSVNDLATDQLLTIETKGDRDYYKFVAGDTGALDVVLGATDAIGDNIQYMIYEIDASLTSEEVPMVRTPDGLPSRTNVPAGQTRTLSVSVVAGRTYIVEVMSNEASNLGTRFNPAAQGKSFVYGTARSYDLTIDAPGVAPPPILGADNGGGNGGDTGQGAGGQTNGGDGDTAAVNIPDQDPFVLDIVDVTPDPRNAAVDTITVRFSEDVTGVDISDFTLTRDSVAVSLAGASVVQVTPDVWQVTGLGGVTGLGKADGTPTTYRLTLTAAGSGIQDVDSALLVGDASETWTLTNRITFTGDSVDADPGDGLFADRNGNASLRAAIMEANASPGLDVVRLAAGTYTLSVFGQFEDAAAQGDLDITDSIRIVGEGAGNTIIDAAGLDRVFHVHPGVTLILENLTVRGGQAADGAGIFVEGRVLDSTGAVDVDAGSLRLLDVNVINNSAFNQGGGIYNLGTVDADRSSISFNVAGSRGGGIYNLGIADLRNVTVSTNTAISRGGGIYTEGTEDAVNATLTPVVFPAQLKSINSTIAANTAGASGGGLYVETGGSAELGNTLLDLNTGGFSRPDLSGRITSRGNNLIGDLNGLRADSGLVASDIAGGVTGGTPVLTAGLTGITDAGGNGTWHHPFAYGRLTLTGTLSIASGSRTVTGSGTQFTTQVLVGALLSIDGTQFVVESIQSDTTLTVTVAATSSISNATATARARGVDAGNRDLFIPAAGNTVFDEVDQIGSPRLIEGDEDAVFAIDIGAVEFLVSNPVASFTATPNPVGQGETVTFDATASTHTNPSTGSLVLYEWDFDFQNNTFTVDATGVTASTSYNTDRDRVVVLRVTDNANNTDTMMLTVIVGVPTAPQIVSPLPVTTDSTPTISWINATGTFSLVINNLTTGANGVVNQSGLTTNSYTVPASLTPGRYEAIVTATNADGSTSSLPYEFEIVQLVIQNPATGTDGFDTSPKFVWNAVPDTERYVLWINQRTPNAVPRIVFEEFIDGTTSVSQNGLTASYEVINSLPVGTYTGWVQAIDTNGNAGDWSPATQFEISRIMVTGPAPQSHVILDRTPTITWEEIGASTYELWVTQLSGETTDGAGNIVNLTAPQRVIHFPALQFQPGQPRQYTPTTELNNGQYRIWVRPLASDGEPGLWSPAYDLQVDFRVGPTAISPTGTVTDRTPEFVWTAIIGADHYELWVNRSGANPATRIIHNANIPHVDGVETISYTDPSVKLINPGHRWWVRAFTADGEAGAWSAAQTFFIPAPVVTGPTGTVNSTGRPTFTWTGVPEWVRYELWVNNTTTGAVRVVHETQLTGTAFTPDLPLADGTLRVWVRGFDAQGNDSQWSNPVTFVQNTAPTNAPTLTSPSGFTVDNTPLFTWTAGGPAATYELIVKQLTNLGQTEVVHQTGITGTSYQQTSLLSPGNYRWWVRGLNSDGNGATAWSQPRDFRIVSSDVQSLDATAPSMTDGNAAESVIMTAVAESDWQDDLHSITVHPAAVVAVYHTEAPANAPVQVEQDVPELDDAGYQQLDAVLEAFAVDGLLSAEEAAVEPELDHADVTQLVTLAEEAPVESSIRKEESPVTAATAVGLGLAAVSRRSRQDGKRRRV